MYILKNKKLKILLLEFHALCDHQTIKLTNKLQSPNNVLAN